MKKAHKILIAINLVLWLSAIILFSFFVNDFIIKTIGAVFFGLGFVMSISLVIFFSSIYINKFYNFLFIGIGFLILGLFIRRFHIPGVGPLLVLSSFYIVVCSISIAIYVFRITKDNPFIKWYSLTINSILALQFIGFVFTIMHWSGIIYKIGTLFFIVAVFSLIFTLPFSNYIDWSDFHKKIFYRTMLIPLGFVFILTTIYFVFPDFYQSLFYNKTPSVAWDVIFEK